MDVQETRVRQVLEGAKQYLVPLYQRPYAWEAKQRDRLWSDIVELANERRSSPDASHFMGSLVLSLGNVGPGGTEFLVVDGQQRLTTISILLCAIRDNLELHETDDPMIAKSIHAQYLADPFKSGDARLKVLPTQADRDAFRALVDGAIGADTDSGVGSAYSYFRRQLEQRDEDGEPLDVHRIQEAVLGGLVFVSITAKQEDNVYRIFESLNNTGLKLTQGDLVRNYLFMRLGSRGESAYQTWWLPMQNQLSSSDLELLFWLDAVMRTPSVKQTDIYSFQQARLNRLDDADVEAEVRRFAELAGLLALIRNPEQESDSLVSKRLSHLVAWGTETVIPLLLGLLDMRAKGGASSVEIASAMAVVESFLVRRTIVGGPTAGLNGILLRATLELAPGSDVVAAIRDYLSEGRKYFASDAKVRAAVLREPFYLRGRANQKKQILAWIEESLRAKEVVDISQATIEHVLPQTMTPEWRTALAADLAEDESVDEVHEELVHTLGNLTLTGYNSELSNKSFEFKQKALASSGFTLNHAIAQNERWGRPQIFKRGEWLADLIVDLWVSPSSDVSEEDSGVQWDLAHQAIMAVPAGNWTTYGDLAALIGTHPVPMGQHLATVSVPGAWRVLQAGGTISPGFRWMDGRAEDPKAFLEAEGLRFDTEGHADPALRMYAADLAAKLGLGLGSIDEELDDGSTLESSFIEQLSVTQAPEAVHGTIDLMERWVGIGGSTLFGTSRATSCFLMGPRPAPETSIWPLVIYPSGSIEVVFQYLKTRAPFDTMELRRELKHRLNAIPGIDLPADSLERRPSFPVDLLGRAASRDALVTVLEWFVDRIRAHIAGVGQGEGALYESVPPFD